MALSKFREIQFKFWRYAEVRALFEWQSFYALRGLMKKLPEGDGHPVIVFPGFGGSDRSTAPMRSLLKDLGYQVRGWGLGSNLLYSDELEAEMVALVRETHKKSGRKVSLIGWSLGGLFAREIAKVCPEAVRGVISMGSPISGKPSHSNAHAIFRAINGEPSDIEIARFQNLNLPPPVPTTSLYSKTDGIVAWEGSVQKNAPQTENIEIPASHLGIGVNPLAMYVVADRLSQPQGEWNPFDRGGLKRLLFKRPSKKYTHVSAQTA